MEIIHILVIIIVLGSGGVGYCLGSYIESTQDKTIELCKPKDK